jgi:hypothetical protein
MTITRYDIFISYNHRDDAIAKWLDIELQARGVRTFLDKKNIEPGSIFEQSVFAELGRCKSYALIVTSNSLNSAWVLREYQYALERGHMPIIPLLFESVDLPETLASHSILDFRDATKRIANLTSLMFPGITGKRLHVWMANYDANPGWIVLQERLLTRHGVSELRSDDLVREWYNGRLNFAADPRERVIAVVNLFGGWAEDEWRVQESARCLFDVRERTRNAANEVVFILFHDPLRLIRFRPILLEAVGEPKVDRLRHYFQLDITKQEEQLAPAIDVVWNRALQELMKVEHRPDKPG